jgi:hypothetical protein
MVSAATPAAVVGLGRLLALVVRSPQGGAPCRITPSGDAWLAWRAATRDLLIVRAGAGTIPARIEVPTPIIRQHARFHGARPDSVRLMEAPEPVPPVRALGLIESVAYEASGIRSPMKRDIVWIHQFGDRGERGRGRARLTDPSPYPDRLLPRLEQDAAGAWFIVRRPGCRYVVKAWILS